MPLINKALRRESQQRKAKVYAPRHRSLNRSALRASRQARRSLLNRYG